MCTVTVLTQPGGFLLATNRDESPRRGPALPPEPLRLAGRRVLFPRDSDAGGTWVAVDETGHALCLLNGDRRPAAPPPDEPVSRGQLVLDLLERPDHDAVRQALERRLDEGRLLVRSFKLVLAAPGAPTRLITFDGRDLASVDLPGRALVVSSTFRSEEVHARREQAFATLRADAGADPSAAQRRWHADHAPGDPAGDAYSVCMHRQDAASVSFTQVEVDAARVRLRYQPGAPCAGAPAVLRELARRHA